ncbi:unnamed protein product [Clonostachys solani]|uniref:Tetrapyrrole methylase domain-containing protein n=1 Tax=Clonostachys solani TaxID=160281 RepID=A0A9N9ZIG5_9HYPO|nr:unnamed protein product [Clonostachys solani]
MRRTPASHGFRPGRLVIVGSGIKSISQFTLEAISEIESADMVFYCVADPATELFIESHSKKSRDLYDLYDDRKQRNRTYTQMAEVILREVRKGFTIVGVFYGHPGVFVNPAHRAISIARNEGFEATMLPGVSAEDCLFADLGIDPCRPGCQTLEATNLLLRNRPLSTDCNVILFQVGSVGDLGFNFSGFKNTKFQELVKLLLRTYGVNHPVVHYVASYLRVKDPVREHYTIKDLERPEIAKRITGISTFYIPPKDILPMTEKSAKALGLKMVSDMPANFSPYAAVEPYGKRETAAVKALDNHKSPKNYKKTRCSPALFHALKTLATDTRAARSYKKSPGGFAAGIEGLRADEKKALVSGNTGLLRLAMKASTTDVATQFVQAELRNPTLATQYASILKDNLNKPDGNANVEKWLEDQGYSTTIDAIYQAWEKMINSNLDTFDSVYATLVDKKAGPTVVIQKGGVSVNGKAIVGFTYSASTLSWNASDGNASSAVLHLQVLTDDDGKPLPPDAYIGPQFYGIYWAKDASKPSSTNAYGKIGVAPGPDPGPPPVKPTPLSTFYDNYQTYLKDATGKYQKDSTLVVAAGSGTDSTVTYGGKTIQKFVYSNQTLSWSAADGNNTSGSISFYVNTNPTQTNPTPGNQFAGKQWASGATAPTGSNFFGQIGSSSNPDGASADAAAAAQWRMVGINLGVGIAVVLISNVIQKAITAAWNYFKNPTAENKAALDEANQSAEESIETQESVTESAAEANPSGESVIPDDVPSQAAEAEAAEAEAAEAAEAEAAEAEAAEAAEAEAAEAAEAEAAEAAEAAEVAEVAEVADVVADVIAEVII